MNTVNKTAKNNPPLKPCDYFDMIGGTSTGGYSAFVTRDTRLRADRSKDHSDHAWTPPHGRSGLYQCLHPAVWRGIH